MGCERSFWPVSALYGLAVISCSSSCLLGSGYTLHICVARCAPAQIRHTRTHTHLFQDTRSLCSKLNLELQKADLKRREINLWKLVCLQVGAGA